MTDKPPTLMRIAAEMAHSLDIPSAAPELSAAMHLALSLAFDYPEYARAVLLETQCARFADNPDEVRQLAAQTIELFPIRLMEEAERA